MLGRGGGGSSPVVATFEGEFDPATGKLTLRTGPPSSENGLVAFPTWSDGAAGSGPDNTLELRSGTVLGTLADGCAPGRSWEGDVVLSSFYRNQTFSNVYVELTSLTPSGFEACNSAAPVTGVSAAFGLWSYGTIGRNGSGSNSATRTWRFRLPSDVRFTFTGRIMADLGAPEVVAGAPEFDWSPSAIVTPPGAFASVGTTTARTVWNGTSFVVTTGPAITLVPNAAGAADNTVGLWSPAKHWVGPFTSTTFFIANEANGGDAVNTSGDFTVCAKFKPGAHPGAGADKVLVAKGKSATGDGWTLMQRSNLYCFEYGIASGGQRAPICQSADPVATTPQNYTYDYVCGGRAGDTMRVSAHGRTGSSTVSVTGAFATPAALPLTIGAYHDGVAPATDAGVYEVILDSRAATFAVMDEIVGAAEARALPGSTSYSRAYLAPFAEGTTVTGADGSSYPVPPYASVPLAADGSGLLAAGATVEYTHPLNGDTSTTGFCVGVEVVATGAWSAVSGGLLDFGSGEFALNLNPFRFDNGRGYTFNVDGDWIAETAWTSGSTHIFKACADAFTAPTPTTRLYEDGTGVSSASVTNTITNLADATSTLRIGTRGATPLSGARIRRVFACPNPDHTLCN